MICFWCVIFISHLFYCKKFLWWIAIHSIFVSSFLFSRWTHWWHHSLIFETVLSSRLQSRRSLYRNSWWWRWLHRIVHELRVKSFITKFGKNYSNSVCITNNTHWLKSLNQGGGCFSGNMGQFAHFCNFRERCCSHFSTIFSVREIDFVSILWLLFPRKLSKWSVIFEGGRIVCICVSSLICSLKELWQNSRFYWLDSRVQSCVKWVWINSLLVNVESRYIVFNIVICDLFGVFPSESWCHGSNPRAVVREFLEYHDEFLWM